MKLYTINSDKIVKHLKDFHLSEAGANLLVAGSYIFKSQEPRIAVDILRNA